MAKSKGALAISLFMLTCFVFLQTSVEAQEKSPRDKTILVVSATTVAVENNDQIGLELDIDENLKKSLDDYLARRRLTAAAPGDDANYVLEYKIEKVEINWRMAIDVSYLLRKRSGEKIFAGKLSSGSIRGWQACVNRTSRIISAKTARALRNRMRESGFTGNIAATTATPKPLTEDFPAPGGNTERLREERKREGPAKLNRPNAIVTGLSYYTGNGIKGLSGIASFERQLSRKYAIYGKIGYLSYDYKDSYYSEIGRGYGGEIGFNVYPGDIGFHGPYVGAGVGRWSIQGHWEDDNLKTAGTGKALFYDYNVHMGYKLSLSRHIFLNPSVQAGVTDRHGNLDGFANQESIFGWVYSNLGLAAGITW